MNESDWHWIAGIWEGEGTAGLRWAKRRHEGSARRAYLYVAISQRETSMLLECQRIAEVGKVYPTSSHGRPLYAWYCACAQARKFLNDLLPYVRSEHKRTQLVNALALDMEMREEGTRVRRATLARCSAERWSKYRAQVPGRKS